MVGVCISTGEADGPAQRPGDAQFDAGLFDLDGVITMTAKVHAECWQQMFDGFLAKRAKEQGEPFQPIDSDHDYRLYVDGKPRAQARVPRLVHSRAENFALGGNPNYTGAGEFLAARLCAFTLHARALTPAEVEAIHRRGPGARER